ncbi:MAG: thiamine pyrophosphate-dependent enzyme, partial [Nocardioidaceae bacterium]
FNQTVSHRTAYAGWRERQAHLTDPAYDTVPTGLLCRTVENPDRLIRPELVNPDFAAVARAIGLHGVRVTDPDDVDTAVRDAPAHPGPVLLDVVTDPDEIAVPPRPTLTQAGASRSRARRSSWSPTAPDLHGRGR